MRAAWRHCTAWQCYKEQRILEVLMGAAATTGDGG